MKPEDVIRGYEGEPLRFMEVCGTHTRQITQLGIPSMFPPSLSLISGPGCPVCVTPAGFIDRAAQLAMRPNTTLLSYGDLMRMPGETTSLLKCKASGGSVAMMYSPLEAITHALREPTRTFIVTAVGFETTLPAYALLIEQLISKNITNVKLLVAAKALVPALGWICEHNPDIQGFIGPGHVSAILGYGLYEPICQHNNVPLVVAGFEYEHLTWAIAELIGQARRGGCEVKNCYPSTVTRGGNMKAIRLIDRYFKPSSSIWRGLGMIDNSGYFLRDEFARFDAGSFDQSDAHPAGCLCGMVIAGRARPIDCPHFGTACTPEQPIGPCMVSSEGTCGIWLQSGRTA